MSAELEARVAIEERVTTLEGQVVTAKEELEDLVQRLREHLATCPNPPDLPQPPDLAER